MAEKIIYYGYTDTGKKRDINQDSILMKAEGENGIFCVADGMGGHSHGEIASSLIAERIGEWADINLFSEKDGVKIQEDRFDSLCDSFEECIHMVNEEIRREYCIDCVCGSTLVALLIAGRKYAAYSVGDSRIYRKSGKEFMQITKDQIWQNQPEIMNTLSENEKKKHPDFGKLTNAVGAFDHIKINTVTGTMKDTDIFTLCSDGIYKCYTDFSLKWAHCCINAEKGTSNFEKTINQIKKHVDKKGAPDNYSIIIVGR
ncbi:PP2C family protein-serine/threonine phosphatase [Butyrivibrio sp. NC2002]|uniref:PP2C family protein-serine/threonine phosphatase n=1 Tax=Butyrivibrio sp. NC2002 TaxID=1410610 RepID=UPI0005677A77|nr:PP2C family serine/threonine-protein phosphatase [Butyrivibrio sp. NC2002]